MVGNMLQDNSFIKPSSLSDFDSTFSQLYVNNGFNGTKAYLTIKPNTNYQVAAVQATRLLKKDSVICEVSRLKSELVVNNAHSKPELLKRAHNYEIRAANKDKLDISLKSIDLQAKISGHYNTDTGDNDQFDKIIAACQVNVTVNTNDKQTENCQEDIEITVKDIPSKK